MTKHVGSKSICINGQNFNYFNRLSLVLFLTVFVFFLHSNFAQAENTCAHGESYLIKSGWFELGNEIVPKNRDGSVRVSANSARPLTIYMSNQNDIDFQVGIKKKNFYCRIFVKKEDVNLVEIELSTLFPLALEGVFLKYIAIPIEKNFAEYNKLDDLMTNNREFVIVIK